MGLELSILSSSYRDWVRVIRGSSSNRDSTLQCISVKFTLNFVPQTRSEISVHYNWWAKMFVAFISIQITLIYHMTRTVLRVLSLQNHWWKSRMRAVRICASGTGKSRTALLQKRTASRVKTPSKFVFKLVIKYLLTKLGRVGWENIRLSVLAHRPRCARSVRHDLEPNTFPSGSPT